MIGTIISEKLLPLLLMQGTACVAVGIAASYFLRHRPARAHQILLIALLAALLTPGAYVLVRHFGLGALPTRPLTQTEEHETGDSLSMRTSTDSVEPPIPDEQETYASHVSLATEVAGTPVALSTVTPVSMAPARSAVTTRVPWGLVGAVGWVATSILLLLRLTLRFFLGLQLLRTAHPLASARFQRAADVAGSRLGMAGPIRILGSERLKSPVIWCWARRPVLLVHGEAARREDNVDWVGIFCHELAHLRRLDHLSGLFAEALTALFPWHPLLWWARGRLVRLSEQACDDWVLAAGETGVDYAESLLDLAPQRQMAILPTVVGKEKAMKERIHRIVRDGCGNPRIGRRWAVAVSVLAMLAVVGVAFAQRRPEPREEFAGPRPALVGRRNVLMRLRDQLADQARETENALRERGDEMGEEGRMLRAELETLHQQIEIVEQQLRDLEGGPRPPDWIGVEPRAREQAEQREIRAERLRDLGARAAEIERELREHPDMEPDRADALREELRRIHEQAAATERELQDLERRRQRREREQPEIAPRGRAGAPEAPELERHRAELGAEMRRTEQELRERHERGQGEGPEIDELRERLEMMSREMAELEARRERGEALRPGPPLEEIEAHLGDLRRHREELAQETGRIERELQGLRDDQDEEARELRARLQELHSAMGNVEREMAELQQRAHAQVELAKARERAERARAEARQAKEATERMENLARRRRELQVRLREIQRELEERPDQESEEARALRREHDRIQEEIAATERELEDAQRARATSEGEQWARERATLRVGPVRRRPEPSPALERQVDELRNQMQELREQMQQMRELLEQSLQRGRADRTQDLRVLY